MPPKVIIISDTTLDAEYERGWARLRKLNMKPCWKWNQGEVVSAYPHISANVENDEKSENGKKVC